MKHDIEKLKTIRVVNTGVLLLPADADENKSSGGIILSSKGLNIKTGWVVKFGPGYRMVKVSSIPEETWEVDNAGNGYYMPLDIQEGDFVWIEESMCKQVMLKGVEYLLVRYDDILLVDRPE